MPRPVLIVTFQNGSNSKRECADMREAYDWANRVSVSGGKVKRIEINTGEGLRALWDATWTDESNRAGLEFPA